jgi:hypothetical protein
LNNRYGNRTKTYESPNGQKNISLTTWWARHPRRRQYDHVVFAPGKETPTAYNLWQGFAVAPDFNDSASKCARYLAHVRENVCGGNEKLYKYVVGWLANGVQHPGQPGGAALVLRGKMGVGKGEFVRHYGTLFGPHFIPVTRTEHISGHFNAHLGEAVVLFADECFFPGNGHGAAVAH